MLKLNQKGLGVDEYPDDTVQCLECNELVRRGAKKCIQCKSYQDL